MLAWWLAAMCTIIINRSEYWDCCCCGCCGSGCDCDCTCCVCVMAVADVWLQLLPCWGPLMLPCDCVDSLLLNTELMTGCSHGVATMGKVRHSAVCSIGPITTQPRHCNPLLPLPAAHALNICWPHSTASSGDCTPITHPQPLPGIPLCVILRHPPSITAPTHTSHPRT